LNEDLHVSADTFCLALILIIDVRLLNDVNNFLDNLVVFLRKMEFIGFIEGMEFAEQLEESQDFEIHF